MKQLVHNITISVFEKKIERLKDIETIYKKLLPIDFNKEKISIKHEKIEGLQNQVINVLSLITLKQRHNWLVLENLFKNLNSDDKKTIQQQFESRLDDEGHFYIRIDKTELYEGQYVLTNSGNCFHFKIKIAAFPAKRIYFIKSLIELLEEVGCPKNNNEDI